MEEHTLALALAELIKGSALRSHKPVRARVMCVYVFVFKCVSVRGGKARRA